MREARSLAAGVAVFLLVAPLLAVLRQVAILLVGAGLSGAAWLAEVHLLPLLPVDPVYGGAGLRVLGGIQPYGLAVAGPLGWWLYAWLPGVFSDPVLVAEGAAVSALVEPGITVLARLLTAILATGLLVALVGLLARRASGLLARPAGWVMVRLGQLWLLLDLAHEADLSLRDLEATGLPFALAAFAPVDRHGQRVLLTTQLEHAPAALVSLMNAVLAVGACLVLAWLLIASSQLLGRVAAGRIGRPRIGRPQLGWPRFALRRPVWSALHPSPAGLARAGLVAGVALVLSLSPLRVLAEGEIATLPVRLTERAGAETNVPLDVFDEAADLTPPVAAHPPAATPAGDVTPADVAPAAAAVPAAEAEPSAVATSEQAVATAVAAATPTTPALAAPAPPPFPPTSAPSPVVAQGSRVTLEGSNYQYRLRVDGRPWVVRGMGYNPWYANLPAEERRALYRRDFSLMRETGINTLEGWFEGQFDEVTLDEAHRHGLKVIMPFELNQDYDYSDPAVQSRFRSEVTDWVLRFRDHPAVLMWGPGNEVLHRLIFPTAVQGKRDPSREQRADDFARFYVELMDLVHQLDPNHPVIYRDAEDLYLARFLAQLQQRPAQRPWFVYGTNVYTSRIAEVIQRWPSQGIDAPLLVSEFSPGGASAADRPVMLGWYWSTIRAHPERVLGGVVYTWATRGPEDLDRVFGLTNEAGAPVDGSLGALRQLFRPSDRAPLTGRSQGR